MENAMDVDLSEFEPVNSVPPCKVARVQAELDDDRRIKLEVALTKKNDQEEYSIPVERIVIALGGWGYSIGVTSVRRHRQKVCACARVNNAS